MIKKVVSYFWQKFSAMNDKFFRYGCDFAQWETCEELGIDENEGNKYMPSGDGLKRALKKIPIDDKSKVIDIGCGKGKAMYIMSKFPFAEIKGIDINERMVNIANNNFTNLGIESRCIAIQADASLYVDYDDYTLFYMYNPVPEAVFVSVIDCIINSLEKKPREAYILYLNPVYADIIENKKVFDVFFVKKGICRWFDYYCYRYKNV